MPSYCAVILVIIETVLKPEYSFKQKPTLQFVYWSYHLNSVRDEVSIIIYKSIKLQFYLNAMKKNY